MILDKRFLSLLAVPLLVAGCGQGYELVKTTTSFPYGNERTAGSGYAYVLAKLLPEKELKLTSEIKKVTRDWKPDLLESVPVKRDLRAEDIFQKKQVK